MSKPRKALFTILGFLLSSVFAIAILELLLRSFYPQETLYPRWAFSPQYCSTAYPDVRMVHERPGRWRFVYTINDLRYRGTALPLSNNTTQPNIVVLGDSYTFGAGVNDGEEYASVLERELGGSFRVINLGIGGWGLTQEIRRYDDFGARYKPKAVILQFSANDPRDNLKCAITEFRDGRFEFRDTSEGIYRVKELLSRSWIQKSQIYNLLRDRIYRLMESRVVEKERATLGGGISSAESAEERVYVELLRRFAEDLHGNGVGLVFLSVNGQLDSFPEIAGEVRRLQEEGLLRYIDAAEWLKGESDYSSPEGHLWGAKAHRILGKRLAELLRAGVSRDPQAAPTP
ncbi:MAG: SGNH/GDSL hydrolase family protein [Acidobacteria bacterium]|nr:SGNH/GDSL hydrolase family protein [Acidobacteriota bacterium]